MVFSLTPSCVAICSIVDMQHDRKSGFVEPQHRFCYIEIVDSPVKHVRRSFHFPGFATARSVVELPPGPAESLMSCRTTC
jgi:hypothetical protein